MSFRVIEVSDLSRDRVHIAKGGGLIHIASKWKRRGKEGLYTTLCGLVVSTSSESSRTAHAGYRVIKAEQTTCSKCRRVFSGEITDRMKVMGRGVH